MTFKWALVRDGNVTAKERDDWGARRNTKNIDDFQCKMLSRQNLYNIAKIISLHSDVLNFTCGGSIPISVFNIGDTNSEVQAGVIRDLEPFRIMGRSVVLRTDAMGPIQSFKIEFPPQQANNIPIQLLANCLSAQLPNRLSVNPGNRRTTMEPIHLTADKFSVDFHPAEYGIIDSISKALLPTFRNEILLNDSLQDSHFGVEARLLKMSIYEPIPEWIDFSDETYGNSAKTEFGFLIVCLPYSHKGGWMQQEYQGMNRIIDWSIGENKSIRWVAFFNKVKNHVLNVESGLKVTLTYRLNVTFGGISISPDIQSSLSAGYFPFYGQFKNILHDEKCLIDGGTLGFFCIHQYEHATGNLGNDRFPADFVGLDLAVFSVFKAQTLGVDNIRVGFVLEDLQNCCICRSNCMKSKTSPCSNCRNLDGKVVERVGTCHKLTNEFIGSIRAADSHCDMLLELVGGLGQTIDLKDVLWLNRPNHAVNTFSYSTSRSDVKWLKSYLAIFVQIPTFEERSKIATLGIEKSQRGTKRKANE